MNKTTLGFLLTALSALTFASTSLFLKLALDFGMTALSYTLVSSVFALVILGGMLAREPRTMPRSPKAWSGLLLFGVAGGGAGIAFNVALETLSISLATILLFTYPAFVVLGTWLALGQRPTRGQIVALSLTLVGALLTTDLVELIGGAATVLGVGLALLAAFMHGGYMVMGERVAAGLSATAATTVTRGAMMIGTLLIAPQVVLELPHIPWQGWLLCLLSSGIAGVAPFFFLNRGIALVGANRAAIISVAELPFAMALGLLFQGDYIALPQWAGAVLITAAVVISQRGEEEATHDGSGTETT